MQATGCLLCGARLTPSEFLNACSERVDDAQGALEAICPFCQGRFEVLPANDRLDLGYSSAAGFQVAQSVAFAGLVVARSEDPPALVLSAAQQKWVFPE